jgi:hypothetical protein
MCLFVGLLWIECKQVYLTGAHEHFLKYYNYMDFTLLALYLASYALRFATQYRLSLADQFFNATERALDAIKYCNHTEILALESESKKDANFSFGYFIEPC